VHWVARRGWRSSFAVSVTLAVGLVAGGTAAASPASATVADPVPATAAPAVVDTLAPYLPQRSCDPAVKPGTDALRTLLMSTYGGRDLGIGRDCSIGGLSEHKEGRAFDWGLSAAVPAEKAVADQFLTWLLAPGPAGEVAYNARRLGVMYVIWNGRIWGSYRSAEGWRAYGGAEAHADHIHISLAWNGATKSSSWWTGTAAPTDFGPCPAIEGEMAPVWSGPRLTPCPAPTPVISLTGTPVLAVNSTGPYVRQLQMLLKVTPVSGFFGPVTDAALRAYQTSTGVAVTGRTSAALWAALRAAPPAATPAPTPTSAPKPKPKSAPQPKPKPSTTSASVRPRLLSRLTYRVKPGDTVSGIARYWRSTETAVRAANHLRRTATIRTGQVLSIPVRSWLTRYSHVTIRTGNHNRAVKALQTAMRMPARYRTGVFGDITASYVNRLKVRHHWAQDGVAGPGVWRALGA
jgi:peptidoglycan hydrolase-like protein with peptidoglycan-binding domain